MVDDGAEIIDIGARSTAPGAPPISGKTMKQNGWTTALRRTGRERDHRLRGYHAAVSARGLS